MVRIHDIKEVNRLMKQSRRRLIGESLVEEGILTKQQLKKALAHQRLTNKLLGEVLQELNMINPDDIERLLRKRFERLLRGLTKKPS